MDELNYSEKLFFCLLNRNGGFSMLREVPVKLSLFSSCILELIENKTFSIDTKYDAIFCEERYKGTDERLKNAFNSIIVYSTKRYHILLKGFMHAKKNFTYIYKLYGQDLLHKNYVYNENNYDRFFPMRDKQLQIIENVKPFVLEGNTDISKDDALFLLFMRKCKLLKLYFKKDEIKKVNIYLDKIMSGEIPAVSPEIIEAFKMLTGCYGSVVL